MIWSFALVCWCFVNFDACIIKRIKAELWDGSPFITTLHGTTKKKRSSRNGALTSSIALELSDLVWANFENLSITVNI